MVLQHMAAILLHNRTQQQKKTTKTKMTMLQ
jgi:hypothetical protein